MSDAEILVQKFVGVWNEADPVQRRRTVEVLWRADGRHCMGAHDVGGHDALEERVTASNKRNVIEGSAIFRPATHIQTLPGVIKFRWDMAKREFRRRAVVRRRVPQTRFRWKNYRRLPLYRELIQRAGASLDPICDHLPARRSGLHGRRTQCILVRPVTRALDGPGGAVHVRRRRVHRPSTPNRKRNSDTPQKNPTPMEAVYEIHGSRAETRKHAAGPWDARFQHGSAPSGLLAWAAERLADGAPMRLARLTIELWRPVPIAPLTIRTDVLRAGRKVRVAAFSLLAGEIEVVRANAVLVRRETLDLPEKATFETRDVPLPGELPAPSVRRRITCPFLDGVSAKHVFPLDGSLGPAAVWFRFDRPLIEDEINSPAMRAAMAGDFCNGLSAPIDIRDWSFLNCDTSINLAREPEGDWILVNATTMLGRDGGGVARARLADAHSYCGVSSQTLIIERR